MAWTVWVDLNLVRVVSQEAGGERLRLVALKRLLEQDGPEALGVDPIAPDGLAAERHVTLLIGGQIVFATLEFRAADTLIIRNAWSFPQPDWY